jgi:hypothetical protein
VSTAKQFFPENLDDGGAVMTVVEFPKSLAAANRVERRVARSAAASKPRNSKNGTPEERAAKTALRKEKRLAWFQDFGLRLRVTRSALVSPKWKPQPRVSLPCGPIEDARLECHLQAPGMKGFRHSWKCMT